jgi:hypothetical protein
MYPARQLPDGAKVTRFAPSPTGFVHFGGLFPTLVGERLAHQSGGVFYLRIEDTDAKREVDGAAEGLIKTLAHYGIHFDEGAVIGEDGAICDKGIYGPYRQSQRGPIYHVFAKKLVEEGKAYPVFTTQEELDAMNAVDKKAEIEESKRLIAECGLHVSPMELLRNLTVAQCQLIEIIKAISVNAKVIIMDEPTAAITDREVELLFGHIRRLREQGVAIIYISHRMDEIFNICDRISV